MIGDLFLSSSTRPWIRFDHNHRAIAKTNARAGSLKHRNKMALALRIDVEHIGMLLLNFFSGNHEAEGLVV